MVGSIQYGAKQAIMNCTRVQPNEKVVIITDKDSKHLAYELRQAAEAVTPGNIQTFVLEDYGARPNDGKNPLTFPEELREALSKADVSFYTADAKPGELQSLRIPMLNVVEANEKLRHAHMPGLTDKLMIQGMSADYQMIQDLSAKVYDIVKDARYITVTSPAGSNFTATFNPNYKWLIADGVISAEQWSNLPDGEVYTCVDSLNGRIVIDGVLGDSFDKKYGLLDRNPVTLEVVDGWVQEITCENKELLADLEKYTRQDENARRIGEFAIGTNIGLRELLGNLLQDEKFPGVHVAIGSGYPDFTGADWDSDAHVDGVIKNPTIDVEGRIIMKNGHFTL